MEWLGLTVSECVGDGGRLWVSKRAGGGGGAGRSDGSCRELQAPLLIG